MILPHRLRIWHFLLLVSCCLSLHACDPVLESLIFASGQQKAVDKAFRNLSTTLHQVGQAYLQEKSPDNALGQARSIWLEVYQKFWSYPPEFYATNKKLWQKRLNQIAHQIRDLSQLKNPKGGHRQIVALQTKLVELYEPVLSQGFLERQNMLARMIELHVRSAEEGLITEQKRLATRIQAEWEQQKTRLEALSAPASLLSTDWPQALLSPDRQSIPALRSELKKQQIWWFEHQDRSP